MGEQIGEISIIAAFGKNRGLGFEGKLLWHLSDDLKRFKALTKGHAVIMGRKTFESIGKPLPDRMNIVITNNPDYQAPDGVVVADSMEFAVGYVTEEQLAGRDIFIIGGAEIYRLGMPFTTKMYLTFVDADIPADVFFPEFDESEWKVVTTEPHAADEKHPYPFVFKVFERVRKGV